MVLAWLPLALGCARHEAPPPPPPPARTAPAAPVGEGSGFEAVVRALSMRDGAPPCEQVEALSSDPVADLLRVVDTVAMPPTAGMFAAGCLLDRHAQEVAEPVEAWMGEAGNAGLARLVLQRLDALPAATAVRWVQVGLQGPHAAEVRTAVEASARPELRALLGASGH